MTKRWGWRWCAALVLAAAMSQTTAGAATRQKSWSWTFEADTLGKEPGNSGLATGTWEVAKTEVCRVAALMPAAQVYVS